MTSDPGPAADPVVIVGMAVEAPGDVTRSMFWDI